MQGDRPTGLGDIRPLPLIQQSGNGDSAPFRTAGKITVEITNMGGGEGVCYLSLYSAADGSLLDTNSLSNPGSVIMDPQGRSPVYLSRPLCGMKISLAE